MKKMIKVLLLTVTPIIMLLGCSKSNTPNVPTQKEISADGSILDTIVVGSTSKKEVIKALKDNDLEYTEDEDGLYVAVMPNFLSYDSSIELYFFEGENALSEMYVNLYFNEESEYSGAKQKIMDYLTAKVPEDIGLEIAEDKTAETYYYPIAKFNLDDEEQLLYVTMYPADYDDLPSGDYIDHGYVISEEYAASADWEIITSESDLEDEEDYEDDDLND